MRLIFLEIKMKTILVFRIGYLNLSQLKHFLLHLCSQLKRKGGLGLTRRIGNNLSIVLQEHQKTNKNILYFFYKFIRDTFYSSYFFVSSRRFFKFSPDSARDRSFGGFYVKVQIIYDADKQLVKKILNIPT